MRNRILLVIGLLLPLAAAQAESMSIPAGATISVRMTEGVDSIANYVGQTFHATVAAPLEIDGKIVVPQGAEAIGRLTAMEKADTFQGRPSLSIELTALNFNGRSIPVQTSAYQEVGPSRGKRAAMWIGGVGLFGTVVGAIAGGVKGTFIGMATGAGAGAVANIIRRPKHVSIPAESMVNFTLQSPIPAD